MPKFNMYQSLHTTVIGPEGKPVELQIRTFNMHHRAEYGIAAHWKYKEGANGGRQAASDVNRPTSLTAGSPDKGDQLAWLRQMLDWQRETSDPGEFLDSLRFDLQGSEVFVFTPKGDVVSLPVGFDPGRLRVRRAHRGRPPMHRRPDQRPAGAAGEPARQRRHRRDLHLEVAHRRPEPRLDDLRPLRAGPQQDPPVVRQGAARRRDRRRSRRDPAGACASRVCRCSACSRGSRCRRWPRRCASPTSPSLYAAVGEGHVGAQTVVHRLVQSFGGPEGAVEDIAETALPSTKRTLPSADPGRHRQGRQRRLGQARPLLHADAGRSDPRFRHARQGRVGPPRRLPERRTRSPAAATGSSRSSGRRRQPRSSWSPSRSRRSTAPGCCRTSPGCCPITT